MKVYIDDKDKMTSYQWGYDEESKRYFVKINFDVPSDTKVKVLSLTDYTKQVRKEVCQEIREKMTHWEDCLTKEVTEYVIDKETLDKIEKGE